jgi:catechol 2,3-dioxygenase-like lactoylglutathione lyase family enzyme
VITGYHIITLAARDPQAAGEAYARFLGRGLERHGAVASVSLGNLRLELSPAGPDAPEGIIRVTFAVPDLAEARRMLERRGAPTRLEGDTAVIDPAASHGADLAIAEAEPEASPAASARCPDAIEGLDHLVVRTCDADRAIALYGARLGLDFRLDRSNPAWGSRLLFFRCGDAVLEIAVESPSGATTGPDRLGGLAWRARDPAAVHARLAPREPPAEGLDVSELRAGRKPGTHVFTLRAGVVAAPALVIGSEPRE